MNLSLPLFDLPPPPPPPRPVAGLLLPEPPAPGAGEGAAAGRLAGRALPAPRQAVLDWEPQGPGGAGSGPGTAPAPNAADDTDAAMETDTEPGLILAGEAWGGLPSLPTRLPTGPGPHPDSDRPLPAGLWRAHELGGGRQRCTASGFATLDAQLPGGGWPHGVLTELLLAQPGIGELRLLAPALGAVTAGLAGLAGEGTASAGPASPADEGRCVMLFDPPAALSAWALAQQGQAPQHWLVVQARAGRGVAGPRAPRTPSGLAPLLPNADLLWALEQALRSGHVGAVLAWLPATLRSDALRRLQLAAQQHDGPVFLFREAQARSRPSAAPLRLLLQPAGVDGLVLRLLKRRGPPLAEPLRLQLPPVLTPQQQAQALTRHAVQQAGLAAQRSAALAPPAGAAATTTVAT